MTTIQEVKKLESEAMQEKYRLKREIENLMHNHIMEEIAAAAKAKVKHRGRHDD